MSMPSITLSGLTATTPDGRALFSNLDLSFDAGRTGLVGRNGIGKTTLLRLIAGTLAPHAGSVSVRGTLGVLRQTVQVAPGETLADLFGVTDALDLLRRAEEGRATAEELASADWTLEARMASALGRVGLYAAAHNAAVDTLRRTTHARRVGGARPRRARLPPARRADQQSRPRGTRRGDRACWRAGAPARSSSATTANCSRRWMPSSS